LKVRGAEGPEAWGLDEVDEARRVVDALADELTLSGVEVVTYHDDVSKTQSENLDRIVDFHNSKKRDLDISVHFNAYEPTSGPRGVEVLYVTQEKLAAQLSAAIASCGFIDRGAKYNGNLAFLNGTAMPAVLIEVCFVDSEADVKLYEEKFEDICSAIADVLIGSEDEEGDRPPPPTAGVLFEASGRCSSFGGPQDEGVAPDEGLAFIYDVEDAPHLFLKRQPPGTTGLARRLDPSVRYIACRWDYDVTPKQMLLKGVALVRAKKTGRSFLAYPADWGPHQDTGRIADLSPGLMEALGIETDDEVEVFYPYHPGRP
jgi:N-acetylmuramoyl-L-alanine amidase